MTMVVATPAAEASGHVQTEPLEPHAKLLEEMATSSGPATRHRQLAATSKHEDMGFVDPS